MHIRPFQYNDLDALAQLVSIAFASEMVAQGTSPDRFMQQIRLVTRGRMIPFRVLTALAGIKWEILVAEIEGNIVGCGGYLGRNRMELANLMVAPAYRRQGIGQALLVERLHRLADQGYAQVTTTILADNEASLGNVRKQGFQVFDRYTIFAAPLPLALPPTPPDHSIQARPVRAADKAAFHVLETATARPEWLAIQGTGMSLYFASFWDGLLGKLTGARSWARVFMREGEVVGFLSGSGGGGGNAGTFSRPIIADEHIHTLLPAMLQEAAAWLTSLHKSQMRIIVPDDRQQIAHYLQDNGWQPTQSWVRLVKHLSAS